MLTLFGPVSVVFIFYSFFRQETHAGEKTLMTPQTLSPSCPLALCLAVLLAATGARSQQTARCAIQLTFADGFTQAVGGRGSPCCVPVSGNVNVPYLISWSPEPACDRQELSWQRFYEGPSCTGAQAANRRPSFAVRSVWICPDYLKPAAPAKPRTFVFRSAATRQCLTSRDNVELLGQPRLLQSPCSESDAAQGWSVKPAGQGVYTIADPLGRCLTTYSGVAVRAAVVMGCSGGGDQKWSLDSRTSNGKGPYTIRSPLTGACLSNVGKEVVQAKCDPDDLNNLFESAFVA